MGMGRKGEDGKEEVEREECEGGSETVFRWFSCHSLP